MFKGLQANSFVTSSCLRAYRLNECIQAPYRALMCACEHLRVCLYVCVIKFACLCVCQRVCVRLYLQSIAAMLQLCYSE